MNNLKRILEGSSFKDCLSEVTLASDYAEDHVVKHYTTDFLAKIGTWLVKRGFESTIKKGARKYEKFPYEVSIIIVEGVVPIIIEVLVKKYKQSTGKIDQVKSIRPNKFSSGDKIANFTNEDLKKYRERLAIASLEIYDVKW